MKDVANKVFRGYDIRGIYPSEINPVFAERVGASFSLFLKKRGISRCFVGNDLRHGSRELNEAFSKGLLENGVNVVDVGTIPISVLFYCLYKNPGSGGALISASHNPPQYNGIKFYKENCPLFSSELEEVKNFFLENEFIKDSRKGFFERKSFLQDYLNEVSSKIRLSKKMRVVIDCGNGVSGLVGPEVLKRIGCDVVELFCSPHPDFPNHMPDPHREENYSLLLKKIVEEKASLGIALDGDGDRVGFVDELGRFVSMNKALIILVRDVCKRVKGAKIVLDMRVSKAVFEEVERLGGKVFSTRPGRTYLHEMGKKVDADFGSEVTGHMFFKESWGNDDATYAAARMIEILSGSKKTFSELIEEVPHYITPPEIRLPCPDEKKFRVVDEVRKELSLNYSVNAIDGARIDLEDCWGQFRASNTGPEVTVLLEGKNEKSFEKIYYIFNKVLSKKGIPLPEMHSLIRK